MSTLLNSTPFEDRRVASKFDGEHPFTTCSFDFKTHFKDLESSIKAGGVEALEESGKLLGFFLAGHDELIAALNRLAVRKGAGEPFKLRPITEGEAASAPWGCDETVCDEAAGGIVGYLNGTHSDRIVGLLNVESLNEPISKYGTSA